MSSAAAAELGALFINAREAVHIRNILEEMGHPQPPTPIQTDNSTANGVCSQQQQGAAKENQANGQVIPLVEIHNGTK